MKLKLMTRMVIIVMLIEVIQSVITKLMVETDRLQTIRGRLMHSTIPVIIAFILNVFRSGLSTNPPSMLAMDRTKKMNEK